MEANNPRNTEIDNTDQRPNLFKHWFVVYNPLYFISALCFVFGVFMVSRGLDNIDWADGQVVLTGVIELYEFALLAGSFFLYRIASQTRPAIILAILNIVFLMDTTYQTEHLSFVPGYGGLITAFWVLLFALKLWALTRIFHLKTTFIVFAVPVLAAIGVAYTPYLLYHQLLDSTLTIFILTAYGSLLVIMILAFKPTVACPSQKDFRSRLILARIFNAAWLIWGGLFVFHLVSWIRFFDIPVYPAVFAPVLLILPFVGFREELAWIGCMAAMFLAITQPPLFWIVTLMAASVLSLRGYQMRRTRILTGAIIAFYLGLRTLGWEEFPFPDHELWHTVVAGAGLVTISIVLRSGIPLLVFCLGLALLWTSDRPHDMIEWGAFLISVGFATLIIGIITSWLYSSASAKQLEVCETNSR